MSVSEGLGEATGVCGLRSSWERKSWGSGMLDWRQLKSEPHVCCELVLLETSRGGLGCTAGIIGRPGNTKKEIYRSSNIFLQQLGQIPSASKNPRHAGTYFCLACRWEEVARGSITVAPGKGVGADGGVGSGGGPFPSLVFQALRLYFPPAAPCWEK